MIQHKIFKASPKLGLFLFAVSFRGIHCTGSVYINDSNGVRESGNSKLTYAGVCGLQSVTCDRRVGETKKPTP